MQTKRILVHFHVVAWTVCKTSEHNVTLEIDVILPLPHDVRCGKNIVNVTIELSVWAVDCYTVAYQGLN